MNKLLLVIGLLSLALIFYNPFRSKNALIIVDVQNCFIDGTLGIKGADSVVPVINRLRQNTGFFDLIVLTQDYHCDEHVSFASYHPDHKLFDTIQISYNKDHQICRTKDTLNSKNVVDCDKDDILITISQKLWPDHCVMNTTDADFSNKLEISPSDVIIRKGNNCYVDSYSGFFDNGKFTKTNLDDVLKENGIKNVYVTGIALDYCVFFTSKDSKLLGYNTYVIKDACKSTDASKDQSIYSEMEDMSIHVINSNDISSLHYYLFYWKPLYVVVFFITLFYLLKRRKRRISKEQ